MRVEQSIDVTSTLDSLWGVVSDLDNESRYWYGTREVRNISRDGNVTEREVTQNFRGSRTLQRAILNPKSSVEIQYLKGITVGKRIISIRSVDGAKQRLTVTWDVRVTGVFRLLSPWIASHIRKGTADALARIRDAAEARG